MVITAKLAYTRGSHNSFARWAGILRLILRRITEPEHLGPVSNTFSPTAASAYALFCAGHTSMADGRIFIAGGHIADYTGYAHAVI